MNKHLKKIVFVVIFIMLLIMTNSGNTSFAGFKDVLGTESKSRPIQQPSTSLPKTEQNTNPEPNNPPDITSNNTTEVKQKLIYYDSISGNVFEDLKKAEIIDDETDTIMANGVKDSDEKSIAGVRVDLLKDDEIVQTYYTDESGNYSFSPSSDGNYKIRFTYGNIEGINMSDESKIKNVLKYNGQDYYSNCVGGQGTAINYYEREIIMSGKGCAQIFLLIDFSSSMVEEQESTGKTRIESQIEAAKKLAESLFDTDDNIYVGIIAFSEESLIWHNLTKNEEILIDSLNKIEDLAKQGKCMNGVTNIKQAIEYANKNFVNTSENSNRMMFLLSDGIPLTDGNTEIYTEDLNDEELTRSKLMEIANSTKNEMKQLIDNGVSIGALITKTQEEEIDQLVDYMCDIENMKFYHIEDEEVTKTITKDIKETIEEKYQENIMEFTEYLDYFAGCDDKERREQVNNNFSKFDISTTELFKVINEYNSSDDESRKLAKELSERSWMSATTGEYTIRHLNLQETDTEYIIDGQSYPKEDFEIVQESYTNQNLALTLRDAFTLSTEVKVSAIRVALPNGQFIVDKLDEQSSFVDKDLKLGEIRNVQNVEDPMIYYIDNEIVQNCRLQIEYTIIIKNISLIPSNSITIVNYAPNDLSLEKDATLISNPDITNGDYGWEVLGNSYATIKLDNNLLMRDGANIGNNGERYIKVVYSKLLTSKTEDSIFETGAEILEYSNSIGRRMQEEITTSNKATRLKNMYVANKSEIDYDESEPVILVPPTGINLTYDILKFISVIVIIILVSILSIKVKNRT